MSVLLVTLAKFHLLDQPPHLHVKPVRMTTAQSVVQLPLLDNVPHVTLVISRTAIISA